LPLRALAFVASLLAVLVAARVASAQTRVDMHAAVEPDTVEVGDTVVYTVQVMVHGGGSPTDVRPGPTPGFAFLGQSGSAPVRMRTIVNGVASEVNGLTTSFTLRAEKTGSFTVGPAQVTVAGQRRTVGSARVTVVPRGRAPRKPRRDPVDPFANNPFGSSPLDPFKGLFDFGDDDERRRDPGLSTADPKLSLDAPRGPIAFLHATVDKTRAVVGEQVTLTVYLYEDPYARQAQPGDVHEANAPEFVKRSLLDDEQHPVGAGTANVGGKLWSVKIVRKSALFPLKTGRLAIEPMSLTLPHARVGLRETERLFVDVTEPPVEGRPPGYAIGDVGDMALEATVTPRTVARESAIGVNVELRGTGNLPSQLSLPVVPGVEWLEPQVRDKLGAMRGDRFGGTRTLSYVVRVHKEGSIDLGELKIPFFDPDKRTYGVARARLGIIEVTPGSARDAGVEQAEPVLPGFPKERRVLEGPRPRTYIAEMAPFWVAVLGAPVACALALGASAFARRSRERRAAAAPSPERLARERRVDAEEAVKGSDGGTAMGAVARAVETGVLARTGVNVRGAAGAARKGELVAAGVDEALAARIDDVLRACEDARFSPAGVEIGAAREVWRQASAALDELAHVKRKEGKT